MQRDFDYCSIMLFLVSIFYPAIEYSRKTAKDIPPQVVVIIGISGTAFLRHCRTCSYSKRPSSISKIMMKRKL